MISFSRLPSAGTAFALAVIATLCAGVSVGMHHPIQDNNEGLYARIAIEMLDRHSWVIPTVDGVPYLEKPPLLYWMTALSFAVFGTGEAAARFAPMAGFALLLAALWFFAHRWWGERTAILAVCVGVSCPLVTVMARMLMFDMLFTGFYSWSIFAMYEGIARDRGRRWIRVSYAALALAVLTKGLIAVVFYAALALFAVVASESQRVKRALLVFDSVGIVVFTAIAVPWHIAAAMAEPSFAWFYFVNEHVLRFLGRRVPHDYYGGAYWYYVPRLLAAAAPWTFLFAIPRPRASESQPALALLLWAAFLVPFTFFSIAGAKANYYIVVALPALAMLAARRLCRMDGTRWPVVIPAGWALFFGVLWLAAPRFAPPMHLPPDAPLLLALALGLCVISSVAFLRNRLAEGAAASAAVAIPFALLFSSYLDANRGQNSTRDLADDIVRRGLSDIYVFRDYEAMSSLGYYLHRPIGVIDSRSNDLWYGLSLRPRPELFPSVERFSADVRYRSAAIVVADKRRHELDASGLARNLEPAARFGPNTLYVWRGAR